MEKDFESQLKGSICEATAAKQHIAKYFKRYGDSDHQDAKKHQLMFASKILCSISKCENKHLDIYCSIIIEVFSNHLKPNASVKYWTLYVNCIRYFHYALVEKRDFEKAALIYKHISSYSDKLQNVENGITYVNIYCYHLFLQNFLKSNNLELAISNATEVFENLTQLFKELLITNNQKNFQYPDILKKTIQWLFPRNSIGVVYQLFKILPADNVKQMFESLFVLYGRQRIDVPEDKADIQGEAQFIIETVYTFLQIDIMDKMQLQLGVILLDHCRTECRLQSDKPIAEFILLLYDYVKILCAQMPTLDFQRIYSIRCGRFFELFNKYSKMITNQSWFSDLLVLVFFVHSQLQNTSIFNYFWKQMNNSQCFKSMYQLFVESMKLAPCISSQTKLYTTTCCTSPRKHVILSFAQVALTGFVLYCQNVSEKDEKEDQIINCDSSLMDYYKVTIQNNLVLIINHAFKIIDKMDCITSNSQEIEIILTRFKQITLGCKTYKQAGTCISILELFLKIKTKIPSKEWPLLLRRLYKTVTQLITDAPQIGRDIQMCYIASMLNESFSEIDIGQIRTQISIFYASNTANEQTEQNPHEMCLMYMYHTTTSLFKPHLEPSRKKLLHWLESQHILKYYKANTTLLHSLLKSSQSNYDFVIVTKLGKLQTYAMAKISSLYKCLKSKASELDTLSRLERLTFGHVCVMLLNEMSSNQKFQIDSKDLSEDQLDQLFQREEMETFTINNDIKRLKLVWEAFKAFEYFYEKSDSEVISMEEAIIDWEAFLDDLASLALFLQLSGYMEQCSKVWLLHYKCSRLLQDNYSCLRGLTFFCEYSDQFTCDNVPFILDDEIKSQFPFITQCLENLSNLSRQTYQNYILLAVLQIAYYYARLSRYSFAQMLLQYVELKHTELPERQGRYDIIMATMDAIKFRLLWKHYNVTKSTPERQVPRRTAENVLLHRCLLHDIEETLERFHDFSYISSNDGLLYSILILSLVQELAECTANRLCDNFINSLFIATCKCSLLLGLALRLVQVLCMWMRLNLQMEYVDKAQIKLKIIEYVMGLKTLKELREKSTKSIDTIQSSTLLPISPSDLLPLNYNPGMEAIRKLAHVQLSPIKTDKLQLSPSHRNFDLKRYLKYSFENKQPDQIAWTFFMVGCLNARLYFLVEDYDQLEAFYESGNKWLEIRQNDFNKKYYRSIQLMALQHYANFLRAQRKYVKAQQCLEYAIELCENMKFSIDAVYHINFQLQLSNTRKELDDDKNVKCKQRIHNKLRRQLQFNISPENNKQLQNVLVSTKKAMTVKASSQAVDSGSSCSSTMKSNNRFDKRTAKLKQKPKFEICEDSIEAIEFVDNQEDETETIPNAEAKSTMCQKALGSNKAHKTPKITRKTTKSTKSAVTNSIRKIEKSQDISPQIISIDLTDSLQSLSSITSTLSSSLDNLETKENVDTNELIVKIQNLEIKELGKPTETKTKRGRVRNVALLKKISAPVIVLEDSPPKKPIYNEFVENQTQISKTCGVRDKSSITKSTDLNDLTTPSTRLRRQRKIISNNIEEQLCIGSSTATSGVMSRRRQKTIV